MTITQPSNSLKVKEPAGSTFAGSAGSHTAQTAAVEISGSKRASRMFASSTGAHAGPKGGSADAL